MPEPMTDRPQPRRRRRPRLSIRQLIVLVMLVGGGLGWLAYSARRQRLAVAAIGAAGGKVEYRWGWGGSPTMPMWLIKAVGPDYLGHVVGVRWANPSLYDGRALEQVNRLPRVESLNFNGLAGLTDADLLKLSNLQGVKRLDLSRSGVKGPGLAVVRGYADLEQLAMRAVPLHDADLAHLKDLKSLKSLDLWATNLTDAGMANLSGLVELEWLNVFDGPITGRGLTHLVALKRLEFLGLTHTQVTTLGPLRGLRTLKDLNLNRTPINDSGLEPVGVWRDLESVGLMDCPITDQGLDAFTWLKKLTSLDLRNTAITDAGLEKLAGQVGNLDALLLRGTRITDAGLAHLAAGKKLKSLHLGETRITDAGLAHLDPLTACTEFDLTGTDVTAPGVAALRARFPSAKIKDSVPFVAGPTATAGPPGRE